ncbi:MAG TPA: cation:proton antiporter [Steroidobacteraceae bacterium]
MTTLAYIGLGAAIIAVAWLPLLLRKLPLSLPMVALAVGAAIGWLAGEGALPFAHREAGARLLEFVLIIAIMGTGLKLDRPFAWRRWASAWRLLAIVMPLSVTGIAAVAYGLLRLPPGAAVLMGGILAPTDPVLASEVQAGPPGSGEEDEVRFALTSEAGLNDGSAFPFVSLGLLMLARGASPAAWIEHWLLIDVLWKLTAGAVIGFLVGWVLVRASRWLPEHYRLSRTGDGLASVGITFLAYGLTEAAHGYGFVAVFVAAATLRNVGRSIEYAQQLHAFADQMERLAMALVLALLGAAIAAGLLAPLRWPALAFAAVTLFAVRPLSCFVGFIGSRQPRPVRLAIGYFGIRGLGSLYYMSYAGGTGELQDVQQLWAVVALVVLLSVVIYGISANPIMQQLDAHYHRHGAGRRSGSGRGGPEPP